jgi:hypothetical protein
MSNKTIKQRIALVAVSALTAGVLSVMSAPVANAALTDIDENTIAYDRATSVGVCKAPTETTSATAGDDFLSAAENAAQSGEVLAGGSIGFTLTAADELADTGDQLTVAITGPGAIASHTPEAVAADAAVRSFGSGLKSMTLVGDISGATPNTNTIIGTAMSISATAVGTIQITISRNAAAGASPLTIERYTFVVSTTCVTGTSSVGNSFVQVVQYGVLGSAITSNVTQTEAKTGSAPVTNLASSADKISNGGTAYIAIRVKDGTSSATDVTTTGVFSATATNGAVIGWTTGALALQASSATVSGPAAGTAQTDELYVTQGTANEDKPLTTSVSLFFNGALYGTRTITFTGAPTKISISPTLSSIGKTSTTNKYVLAYEITDAAGNALTSAGAGGNGEADFTTAASENNPVLVTSGSIVDPTQSVVTSISTINTESSGYFGTVDIGCGATSGTAKVTLKYTFSNLTSIVSDPYDFRCSGGLTNYKASLDKASYVPGDIATLTITATDSKGNPSYDLDATPAGQDLGSTASPVSIVLPQLTAVTAATNVDEFAGGKKTYKFTVGSTEGTYSGVVDLPLYNLTAYSQVAQTISYKVAASSATVSNADVLKSIVALIASINKQIQALQKLILKR